MGEFAQALGVGLIIAELLLVGALVLSVAGVLLLVRSVRNAAFGALAWISGGRLSLGPASVQIRKPR